MVKYVETTCSEACHKLKRKLPYKWDLNIYRGCEHGCKYCYAIYTHKYISSKDYFSEIHIKTNIVSKFEKLLSSSSWKRDVINLGGVTDSYQPAESKYKIMPEILKLLIRYRTPCIISTKSSLILRDYDLISQLAKITYVNIASTITTTDESIRRKIEPGGTGIVDRIAVLKEFSKTKASTGLHFMPIIPYLTDSPDNIESIYSAACDADVKYLLPGVLYLRGETRGYFFNFIKKKYPDLYKPLIDLYKTGSANKKYKENLYKNIYRFKDKYRVSHDYSRPEWKQPLLFPTL